LRIGVSSRRKKEVKSIHLIFFFRELRDQVRKKSKNRMINRRAFAKPTACRERTDYRC
jgi:hypothetical protein